MKRLGFTLFSILAISFILIGTSSFTTFKQEVNNPEEKGFAIPEDVEVILQESCYGCHNEEAQSDKSKKGLLIDKLPELSKSKLVGKLDGIAETVKNNEMPPEKFLTKYPDKKLTEDEAKRLIEWANGTAEELMK